MPAATLHCRLEDSNRHASCKASIPLSHVQHYVSSSACLAVPLLSKPLHLTALRHAKAASHMHQRYVYTTACLAEHTIALHCTAARRHRQGQQRRHAPLLRLATACFAAHHCAALRLSQTKKQASCSHTHQHYVGGLHPQVIAQPADAVC